MTQPAYTDADVQLIVAATEQHCIEPGSPDADGHDPCSCGQWREGVDGPSWDEHMAEVSLRALAERGQGLAPVIAHEWSIRYPGGTVNRVGTFTEAGARRRADELAAEAVYRAVGPWITPEEPA